MKSSSVIESQLEHVKEGLLKNPRDHQLAFAAWCCERLFPVYAVLAEVRGTNEGQVLRDAIDRLWDHIFGQDLRSDEIDSLLSQCDELEFECNADIPPDEIARSLSKAGHTGYCEQSVTQLQASGMDAVGAVWSSLEACKGDTVNNATRAAQCVLERTDGLLWDRLSPTGGTIPPATIGAIRKQIGQHPRMLDVCHRMDAQLKYLQETKRLSKSDPKLVD